MENPFDDVRDTSARERRSTTQSFHSHQNKTTEKSEKAEQIIENKCEIWGSWVNYANVRFSHKYRNRYHQKRIRSIIDNA